MAYIYFLEFQNVASAKKPLGVCTKFVKIHKNLVNQNHSGTHNNFPDSVIQHLVIGERQSQKILHQAKKINKNKPLIDSEQKKTPLPTALKQYEYQC